MDGELPYEEARRALLDLDRVNRLLQGVGAARRALVPHLVQNGLPAGAAEGEGGQRPRCPGAADRRARLHLLDVGAGSGRLTRAVARAAERRGVETRLVILDRRLTHLAVAGERRGGGGRMLRVAASVEALPFRDGAFDWTFSNLVFHHFGGAENREILGEMRRCALHGAAVIDLRRSRLALWLARLVFPLLGIGRVARHDGLVSLAQSWSVPEVEELVADLPVVELRRRFPFRWSLVVRGG